MKTYVWILVMLGWMWGATAAEPPGGSTHEVASSLFDVIFGWEPVDSIRIESFPEGERVRIEAFIRRFKTVQATFVPGKQAFEMETRAEKEHRWVSIIWGLAPDSVDVSLVQAFVRSAGIMFEWEGMSEGPLSEAQAAESFLKGHENSPIAPSIWMFLAHRYMAASECLTHEQQIKAAENTKKNAEKYLNRMTTHSDPLIRRIGREIGQRTRVYLMPV